MSVLMLIQIVNRVNCGLICFNVKVQHVRGFINIHMVMAAHIIISFSTLKI